MLPEVYHDSSPPIDGFDNQEEEETTNICRDDDDDDDTDGNDKKDDNEWETELHESSIPMIG